MGENTAIEWCDHTFNPWIGCQKVGPGCDHCYAEGVMDTRLGQVEWGPGKERKRTSEANWRKPLKWQREAKAFFEKHGRRQRVFCASLADVFDNAVDPVWRRDLAYTISATPDLEWLLLTKRAGNVIDMLIAMFPQGVPDNVRIGFTIVSQEEWERDRHKIASVSVACVLNPFLSMEPLLGPVNLAFEADKWPAWYRYVAWVIVGGESGPKARPIHPDWARMLRDQCEAAGVPFLFKQWGEWLMATSRCPKPALDAILASSAPIAFDGAMGAKIGKKRAGRLLDGRTHDGFPEPARAGKVAG